MTLAYLPSPSQGVWHVGPFPLRAYALCIIAGVVLAVVVGNRRFVARGGQPGTVADVATIAVPFGLLGARVYHVVTSPAAYLEEPVRALFVWEGGLGIPGGVLGGVLSGYVVCRRRGISPSAFADAVAPGVVLAQAVGRFGNWFNQELYGRPSTLPWALEIDREHRRPELLDVATYHPAFAYEALWNVGVAAVLVWADRRWRLGGGRVFALYLALYAVGRMWIEALRIDDANTFFGVRLNVFVMVVVLAGALTYLLRRRGVGREAVVQRAADAPHGADAAAVPDASPEAAPGGAAGERRDT